MAGHGQANPTINALEVIANACGLTVFDLFDRVREMAAENQAS